MIDHITKIILSSVLLLIKSMPCIVTRTSRAVLGSGMWQNSVSGFIGNAFSSSSLKNDILYLVEDVVF